MNPINNRQPKANDVLLSLDVLFTLVAEEFMGGTAVIHSESIITIQPLKNNFAKQPKLSTLALSTKII